MYRSMTCACLVFFTHFATAQKTTNDSTKITIGINSAFSYKMLDPNQDLRKAYILLMEQEKDVLEERSLTIGTSLIAIADYQKTNTDSKFAYLMRHPTAANEIGEVVTEAALHSFQLAFTGRVTNWLSAYSEILYNPEQSFGVGTITALGRNQLQLRKGFLLFGDLKTFPLYGAIGKMDAPFGQMGSVNPFSNTSMWHAFAGLGYGAQLGFKKWNLHATFMAVQGGSQFRAMNTPVGDSTAVPSLVNNFVVDLNYTIPFEGFKLCLGGSYLHGSAYCHGFPVNHFGSCGDNNPAYTYYGRLTVKDRLLLMAGFAETLQVWPGTHNPYPPLDKYPAGKVSSIDLGAKYSFNLEGKVQYAVSGEFSNFRSGPDGSPWERQNQIVLGFCSMFSHSS